MDPKTSSFSIFDHDGMRPGICCMVLGNKFRGTGSTTERPGDSTDIPPYAHNMPKPTCISVRLYIRVCVFVYVGRSVFACTYPYQDTRSIG